MSGEPVLAAVSGLLLNYFRGELVPAVLGEEDMVKLAAPGGQEDFRLGLCLYDLEEIRPGGPGTMRRLSGEERRHPDLALSLSLFAFANRKAAFHSMEAEDELLLLEAAARAVHSSAGLAWGDGTLQVTLAGLEQDRRCALWQSLNSPLQPAVYFTVEPVPIPSARVRRVPAVRTVEPSIRKKEEKRM